MAFLATLTALFHGLVILPVLILGPIALLFLKHRVRWLEWTFLIVGVLTGISFLLFGSCYLTIWEQQLLVAAGLPTYTEGFVRHYLMFIGIDWPDIWTTWLIRIAIAIGAVRLGYLWWRDRKQVV